MTQLHHRSDVRHRVRTEIIAAATVLVPVAVVLWAAMFAIGRVITHLGAHSAVPAFDRRVDQDLARDRTHTWTTVTHYITDGAETLTVIAVGLIAVIVLRLVLKRWREGTMLAIGLVGEVSIFVLATLVVDRARPPVPHLDSAPPTSSFPSGHTSAAIVLYGGLAVIVWALTRNATARILSGMLGVGVPLAVGLSRMYRGMHYPTDVIAGAILGTVWLFACAHTILWRDR